MRHFLEYPTASGTVLVEIDSGKPASGELVGKIASVEGPASALITKAKQQFIWCQQTIGTETGAESG